MLESRYVFRHPRHVTLFNADIKNTFAIKLAHSNRFYLSVKIRFTGHLCILRIPSSGMLSRVTIVRNDVSEEHRPSSQTASVASYCQRFSYIADYCHPDDGGDKFFRNVDL
jgi:hypothetical protein